MGQRDQQRDHFEHRPAIPQQGRVDSRPAPQPPRIDTRPATPPPQRTDNHPPFQQRDRNDIRSGIQPGTRADHSPPFQPRDRVEDRSNVRPPSRVDHAPALPPRDRVDRRPMPPPPTLGERSRFVPGATFEHHDRRWDERRFADREPHRWHGGHWVHSHHGGHFGWWWVVGPTWYLYPAPIYPYPVPATEIYVVEAPETVTPESVCQVFNGDAISNDTGAPFYGTACLESDGQWHIVMDQPDY